MKTLDEVIAYFDNQTQQRHVYLTEDAEVIYNDALHYLKHLQEYYEMSREHHEPNPPLTWDELKQMEGKPVWVEFEKNGNHWLIITDIKSNGAVGRGVYGENAPLYKDCIGTDWQAYRKEKS